MRFQAPETQGSEGLDFEIVEFRKPRFHEVPVSETVDFMKSEPPIVSIGEVGTGFEVARFSAQAENSLSIRGHTFPPSRTRAPWVFAGMLFSFSGAQHVCVMSGG